MRNSGVIVCFFSALLAGCGEDMERPQDRSADNNRPVPVREFVKNAINLDRDGALVFEGRIVRYDLIRNERGTFDRYVVESPKSLMGLEAAVFHDLARKGYTRRVRQETPKRFLVHYLQKGMKTVIADYRAKDGFNTLQRLVITVRADD